MMSVLEHSVGYSAAAETSGASTAMATRGTQSHRFGHRLAAQVTDAVRMVLHFRTR